MKRWWLYWLAQNFAGLFFKTLDIVSRVTVGLLFFRVGAIGLENIPKKKQPLIITPNHKSYIDHFFVMSFLVFSPHLPARALAADWLFRIPNRKLGFIIRWALWVSGCYPTRRGSGMNVSLRDPLRVLKAGGVVAIYPEGGIRYQPGVHEIKAKGTAYLAKNSGAAVLPVAIRGLEYLRMRDFFFGRRRITVVFGAPFHVEQNKTLEEISSQIKTRMEELYEGKTA